MATTTFSGPIVSENGFTASSSGSTISFVKQFTATVSTNTIAATDTEDVTAACVGVVAGDHIIVTPPASWTADVAIAGAWVSATDEITIRFINATAGTPDLAGAYKVLAIRVA